MSRQWLASLRTGGDCADGGCHVRTCVCGLCDDAADEIERLVKVLDTQVDAHFATWMAARADVEGEELAAKLFEKEPDVILARRAIAAYSEPTKGG